jgi:hypothetical protein
MMLVWLERIGKLENADKEQTGKSVKGKFDRVFRQMPFKIHLDYIF